MVLAELGGLDQHARARRASDAAIAAHLRDARQRLIGALRPFERQHLVLSDNYRLTDVERARRRQKREATRDVGAVAIAWLASAERPGRHQQLGRNLLRPNEAKAMLLKQPADAGLQAIVA